MFTLAASGEAPDRWLWRWWFDRCDRYRWRDHQPRRPLLARHAQRHVYQVEAGISAAVTETVTLTGAVGVTDCDDRQPTTMPSCFYGIGWCCLGSGRRLHLELVGRCQLARRLQVGLQGRQGNQVRSTASYGFWKGPAFAGPFSFVVHMAFNRLERHSRPRPTIAGKLLDKRFDWAAGSAMRCGAAALRNDVGLDT